MDQDSEALPPSFWAEPAVAAALAKCDVPTLLKEVRHARRWTQDQLAEAVGYSQTWVSRVLRGRLALTVDQVREICGRIGVPLHLLRFGPGEGDDQTKRRDFNRAAAAVALAAIPAAKAPRKVEADNTTASTLTAVTCLQRRLEATTPARELARGAVAHLDVARAVLARSPASPHVPDILGAVSEAAGFAAWLHADMHDSGPARTFYRLAIDSAKRARHGLLSAYMVGSLAQFEIDSDDPGVGLALLGQARKLAGDRPPATARAWLGCIEALAHATARDEHATRAALVEAETAVAANEHTTPPWPWVFPFTGAKLAGYRALAAVRLARPGEALAAFAESLASTQPAEKQRAVLMLEVATVRRMEGEFEEAFALASAALSTGVAFASERTVRRARRFRGTYTGPTTPAVRAFDEQLLAAIT